MIGQPDSTSVEENRRSISARSFRWPHGLCEIQGGLWVADAGNHRLLGWDDLPLVDRDADHLIGQPDPYTAREWPLGPQGPLTLRFPYDIAHVGGPNGPVAVADTANNRVLVWGRAADLAGGMNPERALGQPDLCANGENRWERVGLDTLCWPYGLVLAQLANGALLAIADTGNNRVTLWAVPSR